MTVSLTTANVIDINIININIYIREAEHRNDGLFSGQFLGHSMTLSLTLPIALTSSIEPILVLALPVLGRLVKLFGIGSVSLRSH